MKNPHTKHAASLAVIFLLISAFPHGVFAQGDSPKDESETKRIFVPVEDLDTVLARDQQGVLLAKDEFSALLEKAKANTPDTRHPVSIVVSAAEYSASTSGDHLLLEATLSLRQFDKGWHTLELPFDNLAVESAKVNGQAAQIARTTVPAKGKGQNPTSRLVLFHNEPGTAELTLELSTVLESVGNDRAARFSLMPIPSATLNVSVPAGRHLQIGRQPLNRPVADDQAAVYQIPVGGSRDLLLLFNDQQDEQRTDSLTFATTGYGLNVAPGEVTWQASTSLQVYGNTLNQLLCTVPKSLEITDVESTGLESWELSDDPDDDSQTLITLNYRQPFSGRRDAVFRGVLSTAYGQAWAVPALTIRSVTSHIGRVVIQHPPGVRLRVLENAGTRTSGGGAGSVSFDVWQEDFQLALETRTRERELHCTVTTQLNLGENALTYGGVVEFETYFEPLFEVAFRLPAEWQLESVLLGNVPSRNWKTSSREAGWNDYRIPLPKPLAPGEAAVFTFFARQELEDWPVEETPIDLAMPSVLIEEAAVVEGSLVIRSGEDLEVKASELTGLDPAVIAVKDQQVDGFAFQTSDYSGLLTISRLPSRITGSTLTFTRLDREVLNSHLQVTLEVTGGGVREVTLGLSESAGEDLRFRLLKPQARIVEQRTEDPQDKVRNWTLLFDQRLRGEVVLAVDVVSPRGADSEFAAPQITIPGAERVSGFVAFEAAPEQQLNLKSADAAGLALPTVDPIDVPAPLSYAPKQRLVDAFRYHVPGYSVTLSEKRFERVAVPTAVCYSSFQQTVIGSTGELQHEASYEFVAVGAQSLLVQLPVSESENDAKNGGTELWAAMIDGSPVEVRRTADGYLVPLPPSGAADARRTLVLGYRSRMPALTNAGTFDESPPQLTVVHSSGTPQPLEMLDQNWRLHYPDELTVVDSDGDFEPQERIMTSSVLGNLRDSFTKLNRENLTKNAIIAGVLILLVGGIALSLRKLGVGMVGCFGAAVTMLVVGGWLMTTTQENAMEFAGADAEVATTASPAAAFGFNDDSDDAEGEMIEFTATREVEDRIDALKPKIGHSRFPEVTEGEEEAPMEEAPNAPPTEPAPGDPFQDEADRSRAVAAAERASEKNPQKPGAKVPIFNKAPSVEGPRVGQPLQPNRPSDGFGGGRGGFAGGGGVNLQGGTLEVFEAPPEKLDELRARINHQFPGTLVNEEGRSRRIHVHGTPEEVAQIAQLIQQHDNRAIPRVGGGMLMGGRGLPPELGIAGARLSLAFALQVPDGSNSRDFRYTGNRTAASNIALRVSWHNGSAAELARLFLIAAVTLLLWLTLTASFKTRAILVTLGMTLPLALVSVAPSALHNVLDGIFLGSALTLALWLSRGLLNGLKACDCWHRWLPNCCRPKSTTAGLILLASSLTLATPAMAQQGKAKQNAEPARPAGVIIPYEAGTDPAQAGRVLLTREHFLKLWNRANPERQLKNDAPVQGLVADAFYRCSLAPAADDGASDAVAVEATIVLHSFRDSQLTIPLNLGSIALSEAKLDGEAAPLRVRTGKGGPFLDVVLETRGQHVLDLKFSVAAKLSGKVGQFALPVLPVPAGRVVFQLPETGLSVRVNGSSSLYRLVKSGEGDAATESISIPATQRTALTISWRPPEVRGAVDAIVQVDTKTAVAVEDAGIAQASQMTVRVPQGSISDLSFDMPEDLSIRGISGPHLAGWELNEETDPRQLRVFFSPAITDSTSISLDLFRDQRIADQEVAISIATPAAREVTRESEVVAVFCPDTYRVRSGQSDNVTRIDVATNAGLLPGRPVSASKSSVPRVAWRHVERPYQAQFIVSRQTPQTTATVKHAVRVTRRKIEIASVVAATLNGAPRASVSFELPGDYLLINVKATSMQDWFVTEADGVNPRTLTVEFDRPLTGQIEIVLKGHIVKEPDDLLVEVLVPEPFEVSSQTTWAAVWIDDGYTATQSGVTGFKTVAPDQLPADLRGLQGGDLKYAYRSAEKESRLIEFETIKATPDLEADSIVVVSVNDSFLDYTFALNWKIEQAAIDSLSFLTPKTLNGIPLQGKLKFKGERIRESSAEEVGDNLRWTVSLRDAARDSYFLLVTATLPPAKQVNTPNIRFVAPLIDEFGETMDFAEVERQRQYAMLVNQSQAQLIAGERTSTIESVDGSTVPIRNAQQLIDQAAETLRIRDAAAQPSWTVRRFAQQAGAPASVNLADITLVIAADGTWRGQATYTIRNRRRQFLAVRMPDKSQLLSLFVKGRPSRPVTTAIDDQAVQLIALPRQSDADLSFQVKLVFTGSFGKPLPRGFTASSKDLDLPAPHVVTQQESAEYGIPVARTQWAVYLPDSVDASLIEDAGKTNLRPAKNDDQKAYVRTLLQDFNELLTVANNEDNSPQRRMRAANNLKQIGLALHNYHDGNLSGKELAEVQKAKEQIATQESVFPEVGNDMAGANDTVLGAADADKSKMRQDAIDSRNSFLYDNNFNNDINLQGVIDGTTNAEGTGESPGDVGGELDFKLNIVTKSEPSKTKGGKGKAPAKSQQKGQSRASRRQQSFDNQGGLDEKFQQEFGKPLPPFGQISGQQGQQGQQGLGQQGAREFFTRDNQPNQSGPAFGSGGVPMDNLPNAPGSEQTTPEFGGGSFGQGFAGQGRGPMFVQQEMAQAEQDHAEQLTHAANAGYVASHWTSAGGLSLAVDLPATGEPLRFTKVSGKPKLALRVRSRELVDRGFGLIWTIVWLAVATTLVVLFNRLAGRADFLKPVGRLLFAVGLVSFVALSGPLSGLGFVCFLAGLILVAVETVRSRQVSVP